MKRLTLISMAVGTGLLVAACGDGDNGGRDYDYRLTLALTPDNATQVTTGVVNAYAYLRDDLGDLIEFLTRSAAGLSTPTPALSADLKCQNEGNVTIDLKDANGDGVLSPGETGSYLFQNCVLYGVYDGVVADGSVTLNLVNLPLHRPENEGEVKSFFSGFKITNKGKTTTLDGDCHAIGTYTSPQDVFTVKGLALTRKTSDGVILLLSEYIAISIKREDEGSDSYTFDSDIMDSSDLGGSVSISTLEPFKLFGEVYYPSSGSWKITGAKNSSIKITAESDGVHMSLDVDTDGNGIVDETVRVRWDQLALGSE